MLLVDSSVYILDGWSSMTISTDVALPISDRRHLPMSERGVAVG